MKKCLLVFCMLSYLFADAQVKKPAAKKKNAKADTTAKVAPVEMEVPVQMEGIKEEVMTAEVSVAEEVRMDVPIQNTANIVDGEPFYIYTSYREKNLIIAQQGSDYENKRYALLEYFSRKKITPFVFEIITGFYESEFSTVKLNSKYGVINTKGQMMVPCIYDEMNNLKIDGVIYFIVSKNGRYGVINGQNEILIPFEYENITKMYNSSVHIEVTKNGRSGLMNFVSRKMVIPAQYDRINIQSSNLVLVRKGWLYSLFNLAGEKLLSNWYTQLDIFNDNELAVAELNGKKGLISLSEKKIIPLEYEVLNRMRSSYSSLGLFIAAKGGKYGIMGADGKTVLPLQYDLITNVGSDLLVISKNNKKGVLTVTGTPVIPLEYDEIVDAVRYFLVKKDSKYGVIGYTGTFILPVEYDGLNRVSMLENYSTSYLLATKKGKKGIIEAITGKPRIDFIYDDLIGVRKSSYSSTETFNNTIIGVKDGKYGMIEINGQVLIPFVYDDMQYLNSFLVIAGKNGKYGAVDIYNNNNVVLPFEYQFVSHKDGLIIAYKDSYEKYRVSGSKISKVSN